MHEGNPTNRERRRTEMSVTLHKLTRYALLALVEKVAKLADSPPPDDHDLVVFAPGSMPSLNVPIPDDIAIRRQFSQVLGQPVDNQRVDQFLAEVWAAVDSDHRSHEVGEADPSAPEANVDTMR